MSWEAIAQASQENLLQSIPAHWRVDVNAYKTLKDVTSVPQTCGILTDSQLEITELTATEIVRRIKSRELKAVQVLESFAARTAIAHQLVNCLTDWFLEDGLQDAKELDEILDKGENLKGPLHGVPIALKDFHFVKGRPMTMGYVSMRDFVPDYDSALVAALRAAGAVFFCKTTMPQSGMALETVSNLWGRTLNPFNVSLAAGGSSGGDAALVAMKGCPVTPSTDLGGSIRVPAAFNGLYAIRPTSDRIPKAGMDNINNGQISIRLSCGPICHSIEDLELVTKVINAYPRNRYDVTCTPVPWRSLSLPNSKLTIGIMKWDGVVMPHPPILRALEYAKQRLENNGHEVIFFDPPFDCWEASKATFDTYYQSGVCGTMQKLESTGEPLIAAFADLLETYKPRELSAAEALQLNIKARAFKEQFLRAWEKTVHNTSTGRPIDALLCPVAPALGYPHDYNIYWGYTSLFNLLDYPSVVLPIPNFKISSREDAVNHGYRPLETNPYDKPNHDLYDPGLFSNQPSTLQVVGRPFEDEELIWAASILETLLRAL